MCYEERLFRSWSTKKVRKSEREVTASERSRPVQTPIRSAPVTETTHLTSPRKPERREMEEVT